MLPFLASFTRWLRWTSLGGRSLPKGNSLPSRSSALPSGKISGEIFRRTFLAVRTGLEPATPGVTGRYSNQLNYRTILFSLMRFSRTRMQRYAKNPNLQIFCVLFSIFLCYFWFRSSLPRILDIQSIMYILKNH